MGSVRRHLPGPGNAGAKVRADRPGGLEVHEPRLTVAVNRAVSTSARASTPAPTRVLRLNAERLSWSLRWPSGAWATASTSRRRTATTWRPEVAVARRGHSAGRARLPGGRRIQSGSGTGVGSCQRYAPSARGAR